MCRLPRPFLTNWPSQGDTLTAPNPHHTINSFDHTYAAIVKGFPRPDKQVNKKYHHRIRCTPYHMNTFVRVDRTYAAIVKGVPRHDKHLPEPNSNSNTTISQSAISTPNYNTLADSCHKSSITICPQRIVPHHSFTTHSTTSTATVPPQTDTCASPLSSVSDHAYNPNKLLYRYQFHQPNLF